MHRHVIAISSHQGTESIIPDFAPILPAEIPSKYAQYILEGMYQDQQEALKNEPARRRLGIRRKLLGEWLSARGLNGTDKLLMVEQPMRLNLGNGRVKTAGPATSRMIVLNPNP